MITVVIPSYERPQFLKQSLDALSGQTDKGFKVIIVDDASCCIDEIRRLVNEYSDKLNLRLLSKESRQGVQHSRNMGLHEADTPYVAFIDDDDFYLPNAIAAFQQLIRVNAPVLGYGRAQVVNHDGQATGEYLGSPLQGDVRRQILISCFIPSPTVIVNRAAALAVGGFDETFPSCQDWDMWTRLVFRFPKEIFFVDNQISCYRRHHFSSIGKSEIARHGYRKYYRKNIVKFIFYANAINLIRAFRCCV